MRWPLDRARAGGKNGGAVRDPSHADVELSPTRNLVDTPALQLGLEAR